MRNAPASTGPRSKRVPDATSVAPRQYRATRSRRVVPVAVAIAVIVTGLVLPTALPPAGAEAPTTTPTAESSLDPALVAQLDAALDQAFADSGMPGVTAGLWIPGQGEWVATRGVSDLDTNKAMNRANQTKIASITKTFVGTIALQIIGEGQVGLTLDDTIDRWYPDFPEASNITVRMLMNMTSGVAEGGQVEADNYCDPNLSITPDELIALGAAAPRAFAPGDGFEYANVNTVILGRILEKTTGTDLTTLLDERLLGPLGMTRSRFAPDGQLTAPLTHGYTDFCEQFPKATDVTDWPLDWGWAAGAMVSTIDDLHTWGLALGTGVGLTPEMLAARVDDSSPIPRLGRTTAYGLGLGLVRDAATTCLVKLFHNGSVPGYGSVLEYYPSTGAVFALLGNSNGNTGLATGEMGLALSATLEPIVTVPPTESCEPPPPADVAITPVVAEPAFTG